MNRKIKTALISVFDKTGLDQLVTTCNRLNIKLISTGGTADFIKKLGLPVTLVEEITEYPSFFDGRVKTIHPLIAGGILKIRGNKIHEEEAKKYNVPEIDLVVVDLYPFEETLKAGGAEEEIIEKIDIGGITLIREAAKNFNDVVIIPSKSQYKDLAGILNNGGETTREERKKLAGHAFEVTSQYDSAIRGFFQGTELRYGENPHQTAFFVGDLTESFDQLHGKELSYNNLIDTESAIKLVYDIGEPAFAIIKHTNACGLAIAGEGHLIEAYKKAYAADPVSAFGGILAANREVGEDIASLIREQKLFIEVIIAPGFSGKALEILKEKKDCRVLVWKNPILPTKQVRTSFTGFLAQDRDVSIESEENFKVVTKKEPTVKEVRDLVLANIATKHLKSNAIAIVRDGALVAMGCGQTSRVDALKQALEKAKSFGFSVEGAVMSSEAFFPFPDCVEIAGRAGITAVVQPGGSKNDQASIDKCDELGMSMVMTGARHFLH